VKIKITKCHHFTKWYADKVGEVFEVMAENIYDQYVLQSGKVVEKEDCEIVEEKTFVDVFK